MWDKVIAVVVGLAMVGLGCMIMVGALQEAYAPVDSGVGDGPVCTVLVPHIDYQDAGAFNAWVQEHGATNVDYVDGVWYADGLAVGWSSAEDSEIFNHAQCVR